MNGGLDALIAQFAAKDIQVHIRPTKNNVRGMPPS
jgi:hypothetical protein